MSMNKCLKFEEAMNEPFMASFTGYTFEKTQGNNSDYDIKATYIKTGKSTFIEVKADKKTHGSGNVVIEFNCNGKDSGVYSSKSEKYCYQILRPFTIEQLWIPTDKLREFVRANLAGEHGPRYKVIQGGDGNRSRMLLIELNTFKRWLEPTIKIIPHDGTLADNWLGKD